MKKYIVVAGSYRVKVTIGSFNEIQMVLQEAKLFRWDSIPSTLVSVDPFAYKECDLIGRKRLNFQEGSKFELYVTGSFDIKERADKIYVDYLERRSEEIKRKNMLKKLLQ